MDPDQVWREAQGGQSACIQSLLLLGAYTHSRGGYICGGELVRCHITLHRLGRNIYDNDDDGTGFRRNSNERVCVNAGTFMHIYATKCSAESLALRRVI